MMDAQKRWRFRLGVLTDLVERSRSDLGRTAVMKLAFLLQTIKGVPLGYHFRLYTYGPFDSDVLNDLDQAETMRAVKSEMVSYPSGLGYVYSAGPKSDRIKSMESQEISKHRQTIDWVLSEFGAHSAADLELLSTIVYADREAFEGRQRISLEDLCRRVREIKPRFSEEYVNQQITSLSERGLLMSMEGKMERSRNT
jgi:uncharacterized protein